MDVHLIEPDKVTQVHVDPITIADGRVGEFYHVKIENKEPYVVFYTLQFLATRTLHSQEEKIYWAIRARNKNKVKSAPDGVEEIQITTGNWQEFKPRKMGVDLPRDEAESIIIRLLFRVTKEPYSVDRAFIDWDLKASLDFEPFENILFFFKEQGHLERTDGGFWKVTREGFQYFDNRVRQENMPLILNVNRYFQRVPIRTKKPFVFVMMPFREEECPQSHFAGCIKPTVKEVSNYDCIRADEDHEPGKIDNKIWTLIQEAEFIIAEITHPNPNVILELGMALTFGKPVYPFTRRPQQETLSIDNKTLLAEQYTDAEDLKRKLTKVLPKK